jgi:hypothetical protein
MSRPAKFLLLFIGLLLPGVIFVLLKTLGKNEFDVPVLFQDSVPAGAGCEGYVYTAPYTVPDSVLASLNWTPSEVTVIFMDRTTAAQAINRVNEEFEVGEVKLIEVPDSIQTSAGCALTLHSAINLVVLDKEKRIRGQYDAADREEADRLILELSILLKKY